jgi:hypothetical protein
MIIGSWAETNETAKSRAKPTATDVNNGPGCHIMRILSFFRRNIRRETASMKDRMEVRGSSESERFARE